MNGILNHKAQCSSGENSEQAISCASREERVSAGPLNTKGVASPHGGLGPTGAILNTRVHQPNADGSELQRRTASVRPDHERAESQGAQAPQTGIRLISNASGGVEAGWNDSSQPRSYKDRDTQRSQAGYPTPSARIGPNLCADKWGISETLHRRDSVRPARTFYLGAPRLTLALHGGQEAPAMALGVALPLSIQGGGRR